MRKSQRGISLIGFLLLLAVVGFFAYAAMLLVPAYTEYFGVVKSMESVAADVGGSDMPIEQIRNKLSFNFNLQYVGDKSVPASAITINRAGGGRILRIAYDKEIPFLYNVSLLLHFDHSVNLGGVTGY